MSRTLAPDTQPDSEEESVALQTQVNHQVGQTLSLLELRDTPVPEAAVISINRQYGKHLDNISTKTADTAEKCPKPFAGLGPVGRRIRKRADRIRALESAKASFETGSRLIGEELNRCRVEQADDVGKVHQITDLTLAHPAGDRAVQAALVVAAGPHKEAVAARGEEIRTATMATKSERRTFREQIKTSEADASAARDSAAQLELENRFLAGEAIRPTDLYRAAPRPTLAARRRSRR